MEETQMENDSRGWKPKVKENGSTIAGSRTGVNKGETKLASVNYPNGEMRVNEKGVAMDNMGNSPSNKGAQRPVMNQAKNVNNIPSVGLSTFDGLSGSSKVASADREMREKTDHAPVSSSRIGSMETTSKAPTWSKARLPMGEKHASQFTGDGNNPSGAEQKDGEKADHARGKANFNPKNGKK
jgi:hypothetical protein